ncbi:hypothetical protein LguiA_010617 [Lonicera macranthoides]
MRIRKHAKISKSLLFSSSSDSLLLKSHLICQLNQSPWDIITFPPPPPSDSSPPPPPHQFDENYNGNGSLAEYSLGAIESIGSMKLAVQVEETDCKGEERDEKRREANLCCKTDGKQWQCKRETQKRHTMCDYHLAQIKNYNTLAHPSIAKSAASNKPTRARKATTIAPSNPNEFYYYSGFGPRWGKKRDAGTSITHKREREAVEPIKTVPILCYSSSEIDDDDIDEDEKDEDKCGIGKKKRRKPIKARSLKDLCEGMG